MNAIITSSPAAARNARSELIARRSTVNRQGWESFTDAELTRAVELMIAPEDLTIREAAIAVLEVFSHIPADVREQLESGEYLNGGAIFYGLATPYPRILYPEA